MSKDITKKGFLERIPSFSLILIMAVLMVIGMALVPLLRVAYNPTPKQGKQLNVSFNWPGASPRVNLFYIVLRKWKRSDRTERERQRISRPF